MAKSISFAKSNVKTPLASQPLAIPTKITDKGDIITSLNTAADPDQGGLKSVTIKLPAVSSIKALSGDQADKLIQSIRSSVMKNKLLIHTTACGILLHYVDHGDYSRMIRLHAAVREAYGSGAANNLAAWVSYYSTVKWNPTGDDGGNYFDSVKGMGKSEKKFLLTGIDAKTNQEIGAYANPYYTSPVKISDESTGDARKVIASAYTRMVGLLKDRKEKKINHAVSEKFVEDFRAFLLQHGVSFNKDGKPVIDAKPLLEAPAKTTVIKAKRPAKVAKVVKQIEGEVTPPAA